MVDTRDGCSKPSAKLEAPTRSDLDASAASDSESDWPALLGDDLFALINQTGVVPQTIHPLAKLDAPAHRTAAFRLRLADGRTLKARRTWSPERAEQIAYFLNRLDRLGFPAVHGRYRRGLLLEWVRGAALSVPAVAAELSAAGMLLGRLHRFPIPESCPYPAPGGPATLLVRLSRSVAKLVDADILSRAEGDACQRCARGGLPDTAETGIIHIDLCPDNLVLTNDGRLRPVDNESLRIGYLDMDLARSWYRWPLDKVSGTPFLQGYGRFRHVEHFVEQFSFWFLGVLVNSAAYRLGSPSRLWAIPIARLRAFLDDPSGAAPTLPG